MGETRQHDLEAQNRRLRDALLEVRASRDRYAELFNGAPVGYCCFDAQGVVLEANRTAAELLGIELEALIGKRFTTCVAITDPQAFRAHLAASFTQDLPTSTEISVAPAGRSPVTLQLDSNRMGGASEAQTCCRTTLTDVSTQKRTYHMLHLLANAGHALSTTLDYASTIAMVTKLSVPILADACIVDVLEDGDQLRRLDVAFADPSKQDLVEVVKRAPLALGDASPQALAMRTAEPLLLGEAAAATVMPMLEPPGAGVRAAIVVPLIAREMVLGALTFVLAESERSYSARELAFAENFARRAATAIDNALLFRGAQRAIRAREDILSIVSHDLKNQLGTVLMSVTALLAAAPPDERRRDRKKIEIIKRAADRMERMTNDLLDLSSIEAGRLAVERAEVDVNELMADCVEMLLPLAREKNLSLEAEETSRPLKVVCDRERVQQIFANLVGNAIKFTPGGEGNGIRLRAEEHDGMIRFTVQDDGPGIAKNMLRHLFERYWQANESARKGRGLGLYISKGIVETQGGRIWAESRVGAGTSFFFTLPHVVTPPEVLASPPASSQVVLVVDDNEDIRLAVAEILGDHGYAVTEARDGLEAIDRLRSDRRPSLILLDLQMPNMDGRALLARLKDEPGLPNIPIVVMSSQRGHEREAERLGAATFLEKPFRAERLLEVLQRCGAQPPSQRAVERRSQFSLTDAVSPRT